MNSPSWTRTNDTAVNSRMLYRLSYGGKCKPAVYIRDLLRELGNAFTFPCEIHFANSKLLLLLRFIPSKPNTELSYPSFSLSLLPSGQALGLLVRVSSNIAALTPPAYLPPTLGGASPLSGRISHLEGGFTLRCLQRLSLPGLATLPWGWSPTGSPAARPSRSSRTKDGSSQISYARAG